jgi:hypothetical protein
MEIIAQQIVAQIERQANGLNMVAGEYVLLWKQM